MKPFFSIIIPVYNVAQYLRECLDSVLAQTFGDWEAICVDDGSTDGSAAILDEYAAKDARFRVIHQVNAGVSAARNAALDAAKGEFFLFLDGDDLLRSDALEMFDSYFKTDPLLDGIFVHPFIPYWDGSVIPPKKISTRILVEMASKRDLFLDPYGANGYVISRIYRRRRFGHLRFRTDMHIGEDVCFWFAALCVNAKWIILNAEYYLYRQRSDSVCGAKNPHDCVQVLESVLYALRCIDRDDPDGKGKLQYLRRFPCFRFDYLELAFNHYKEIDESEWMKIVGLVEAIESVVGPWAIGRSLKVRMIFASRRRLRFMLPIVNSVYRVYFKLIS